MSKTQKKHEFHQEGTLRNFLQSIRILSEGIWMTKDR